MSTTPPFAFVTLLTSDHYLPGALVVAAALRDVHPSPPVDPNELDPSEFDRVCLVTPETVDVDVMKHLRRAFDVVVGVEVIEGDDEEGLKLLGRVDLKTVLTKLHVFRLTSYRKVIFLDADALPIRPMSHLFRLSASFAAVPDIGWPDIFNSGFLVLEPSDAKFDEVMEVVKQKGTWDGGDQGVLNEWVGQDWERLSFTYNTTPSATYTYAPAYKRFGSEIYNVHFIGPNKPWVQIPLRSPGSSSSSSLSSGSVPSSYDYPALMDRWFTIYDKHYRSGAAPVLSEEDLTPRAGVPMAPTEKPLMQRYESVWNVDVQPGVSVDASSVGAPLGLEVLRRMAVEGAGESASGGGEGIYRTLPLEGRIDLMRPHKPKPVIEEEQPPAVKISVPEEPQTPVRPSTPMTTLPTPGPNELPPAPMFRGRSLPPETPTHAPGRGWPHATPDHLQPLGFSPSPQFKSPPQSPSPGRAASPPIVAWNPAIEDPPTVKPPVMQLPERTYFPNAWDIQPIARHAPDDSRRLFPVPAPPSIPDMLVREGHYQAVIGKVKEGEEPQRQTVPEGPAGGPQPGAQHAPPSHAPPPHFPPPHEHHTPPRPPSYPQPDRSKVTAVFPWEEKPRHPPVRYFPRTDSPPPGEPFIKPPPSPALKLDLQRQRRDPPILHVASPPVAGFPRTTYPNAWDTVPSIHWYASRLIRRAPPPLAERGADGMDDHGYRRWQDALEVSSRDADDEDEGDVGDESSVPSEAEGEEAKSAERRKKYKTKKVQTAPREVRHQAVQTWRVVAVEDSNDGFAEGEDADGRPEGGDDGGGDEYVEDADTAQGRTRHAARSSPQRIDRAGGAPRRRAALHKPSALRTFSSAAAATNETGQAPSTAPATNTLTPVGEAAAPGVVPPSQLTQVPSPVRRQPEGRTFDPARDLDVFKKESEEVLARFLKIGSWEDDDAHRMDAAGSTATV